MNIGKQIKSERLKQKITLAMLAQKADVDQATLSRIENGHMIGTVESHQSIARALGVSIASLYSEAPQSAAASAG